MPRTPDITVAAVTQYGGRFLFVEERINQRLVFNQPAGHVERGESLLAAVVREVREETAWHFEPQALLGVYLWRRPTRGAPPCVSPSPARSRDHDASAAARPRHRAHPLAVAQRTAGARDRLRSPLVLRCVEDYFAGERGSLASGGATGSAQRRRRRADRAS